MKKILPNLSKYKVDIKHNKGDYTLKDLLSIDIYDSLVNKLLLKTDRTSMQYGVEVREPLLDYRLFQFAAQSKSNFFLKNNQNKYPIKKLAYKYITRAIR